MLVSLILELLEVNNSCWFKVDDEIIAEKDDLFVQSRLLESKYKFSKEDVTKEDWPEFSFWNTREGEPWKLLLSLPNSKYSIFYWSRHAKSVEGGKIPTEKVKSWS